MPHKGYKQTEEHRLKRSLKCRGTENPNWRGGKTFDATTYHAVYRKRSIERKAGSERPTECGICGSKRKIVFDHDHKTGKFRGWLCYPCNTALGMAGDNIEILESMIEYLKQHSITEQKVVKQNNI